MEIILTIWFLWFFWGGVMIYNKLDRILDELKKRNK